jgi:phosphate transport system substrate-binding protein
VLAYQRGNGDKAGTIRQFLTWGLSPKGQNIAKTLDYVPLTGAVLARARAEVAKIGR